MPKGRVIVLEGIDGAGTSTLARGLTRWLERSGRPVLRTHQPSPLPTGQQIREMLQQSAGDDRRRAALALSFAADRLLLWEDIQAATQAGKWVICDRSKLSSLVYQGSELPESWVRQINEYAPDADLTLLLDLSANIAMARIEARGKVRDRYEALGILQELAERYRRLAATDFDSPVVTLDAEATPEAVLAAAQRAVEALG